MPSPADATRGSIWRGGLLVLCHFDLLAPVGPADSQSRIHSLAWIVFPGPDGFIDASSSSSPSSSSPVSWSGDLPLILSAHLTTLCSPPEPCLLPASPDALSQPQLCTTRSLATTGHAAARPREDLEQWGSRACGRRAFHSAASAIRLVSLLTSSHVQVVKPTVEQVDFTGFLVNHVPSNPPNRRGYFRLGVDVSILLRQSCKPFQYAHAQAGQNPELRAFYYHLVDLFTRPIAVVFVTDGPDRPTVKRGTKVIKTPHWMTTSAKDLVDAFGFEWIEALGEAEAELASINVLGLIDAVMSDDSDALVFGAQTVIHIPSKKQAQDKVDVLSEDHMPLLGDLLLIAVLASSDYSKGLEGCGVQTAAGLARYGLGTLLLSQAWRAVYTGNGYKLLLDDWRDTLRHCLRDDPEKHVGQRHPALAAAVTDDFPNMDVVMAHVRPLTTSWDRIALDAEFGRSAWFRVARIAQLCDRLFSWDAKKIAKKMAKTVWPAVVMRLLGVEKHGLEWAEHQICVEDCNIMLNSVVSAKTRTQRATDYLEHKLA
ncbi:hypothetical protein GSI_11547 [Ganoderma sinense ZZ0214-1]|uniref:XPG-I domain-containing protein n=1 Tax=Ganoderma sinense ZZ0214-1 TaxID=1077348 RepID=A0A2G8RWC7_9APHY|nr:hypothetical protein GSI_11547 [Ganoderma sinense ZZ0214-1]